ncbi:hypothetical protein GCM10010103_57090 [Streptomyces paradoxus]
MARISVSRRGPGRPRTRPERVVADKGYSSTKIRSYLLKRGIKAVIPERCSPGEERLSSGPAGSAQLRPFVTTSPGRSGENTEEELGGTVARRGSSHFAALGRKAMAQLPRLVRLCRG